MRTPILSAWSLAGVTLGITSFFTGEVNASCTIQLGQATNLTCTDAYVLTASTCTTRTFQYTDLGTSCCLWFAIPVCETDQFVLNITASEGSHVQMFPPGGGITPCVGMPGCAAATAPATLNFTGPLGPGIHLIAIQPYACTNSQITITINDGAVGCDNMPCEGCISGFAPTPDSTYIVNAWVMVENAAPGTTNYTQPRVKIECLDQYGQVISGSQSLHGTDGPIIDGWQRIEGVFTVHPAAFEIRLTLESSVSALFDDVRVFPVNGSMKCYVYDPVTLRFVAELDERHFATFYEYDGEGKLTRVKKETERGVMTIQETRSSSSKLTGP